MSCMKSSTSHLHTEADPSHRATLSGLALTFCLPHFSQGHLGAPQPSPISIVILSLMLTWQMKLSNPRQSPCMSNQNHPQPGGSHQVCHSVGEQLALGKGESNRWDAFESLFIINLILLSFVVFPLHSYVTPND